MPEGPKESFAEWYVKMNQKHERIINLNPMTYTGKNIGSSFKKSTCDNTVAGYQLCLKEMTMMLVQKYMDVFKTIGGRAFLVEDMNAVKATDQRKF